MTPLVRKLAAEHGVDLASVSGTGVGGRIRKQDVLAAAERRPEAEPEPAAGAERPAASAAAVAHPTTVPTPSAAPAAGLHREDAAAAPGDRASG